MKKFIIVAPCYNEEKVIIKFLLELEGVLKEIKSSFEILIVDDGSNDETINKLSEFNFSAPNLVFQKLFLKNNVGHQEAIKQGLKFVSEIIADGYIVMDSDGEDNPNAIINLVELENFEIVFVTRGKRKESLFFKLNYYLYQLVFRIIIGRKINFGNFSMLNRDVLQLVVSKQYIHYPAFISKLKKDKINITFDRRIRIDGKSKMNFKGLTLHGINSLIECSEELLYFFIKSLMMLLICFFGYSIFVLYNYFVIGNSHTGWTSIILLNVLNLILIIAGIVVIGLLNLRNTTNR